MCNKRSRPIEYRTNVTYSNNNLNENISGSTPDTLLSDFNANHEAKYTPNPFPCENYFVRSNSLRIYEELTTTSLFKFLLQAKMYQVHSNIELRSGIQTSFKLCRSSVMVDKLQATILLDTGHITPFLLALLRQEDYTSVHVVRAKCNISDDI